VSRRALTLVMGIVLAVALAVTGSVQTVNYVALGPGPSINTLGSSDGSEVLAISGAKTYPTDGSLALTTVSVQDKITLFQALAGWLSPSTAVIPREIVLPPDKSENQRQQENQQEMQQSQGDATTAALRELGYPATTTVVVSTVKNGAPADGKLKPADVLTSIDGSRVTDARSVGALVRKHRPGDVVRIAYTRDGKPSTVTITAGVSPDKPVRAVLGITAAENSTFDVKVDIKLSNIGGPSAGLMFALGIIDKLTPESLTGGRKIAGTGEITPDGTVGPIGGIAEKMIGAKERGATVFLSPAENCPEAKSTKPDGIALIKVSTLKGALAALRTLRSGGTPPSC
jgi:PDZ domain-containing protein